MDASRIAILAVAIIVVVWSFVAWKRHKKLLAQLPRKSVTSMRGALPQTRRSARRSAAMTAPFARRRAS